MMTLSFQGETYEPIHDRKRLNRQAKRIWDLMADGQGGYQVIEVNAVPGWRALQRVCEVNVADRLIAWLEVASRPDKAAKST